MIVDATGFLPPLGAPLPNGGAHGVEGVRTGALGFESWLEKSLGESNQQLLDADQQVTRLALGETDNLHQVMITLEQSKLSFQLMVQVRNKLLEAYQDVLRMQI